jgi:hypothetical protein
MQLQHLLQALQGPAAKCTKPHVGRVPDACNETSLNDSLTTCSRSVPTCAQSGRKPSRPVYCVDSMKCGTKAFTPLLSHSFIATPRRPASLASFMDGNLADSSIRVLCRLQSHCNNNAGSQAGHRLLRHDRQACTSVYLLLGGQPCF